jgi:hypothetical protein
LIAELFKLRGNDWREEFPTPQGGVKAPPRPRSQAPAYDEIDVEQQLAADFARWRESENPTAVVAPAVVPFPVIAHLTFKIMARQMRFAQDFAAWAAELWRGRTRGEISAALRAEVKLYAAVVADSESPRMWQGPFQLAAWLCEQGVLGFPEIIEIAGIPDPPPDLRLVCESVGEVTAVGRDDAVAAFTGRRVDPRIAVAVADLVEVGPPRAPGDAGAIAVALYVRDLVVEAFADYGEDTDALAISRGLLGRLGELMAKDKQLVVTAFEAAVGRCELSQRHARSIAGLLAEL